MHEAAEMFREIALENMAEAIDAKDRGDLAHAHRMAYAALLAIETAHGLLDAAQAATPRKEMAHAAG